MDDTPPKKSSDICRTSILRTGKNDPVKWASLASVPNLTDKEIQDELHEAIDIGQQLWLPIRNCESDWRALRSPPMIWAALH
jgi:hypothetical protein